MSLPALVTDESRQRPLLFHEVSFDEVGRAPGPHYHRARSFVVWVAHPQLAGIFPIAPQRVEDIEPSQLLGARLCTPTRTRKLYIDLRGFGVESLVFDSMLFRRPAISHATTAALQVAIMLPEDWSRAWWLGAVELLIETSTSARAFSASAEAWTWLGEPEATRLAVEALMARITTETPVHVALWGMLGADPSLPIERAAERLGLSPRGLQRALSAVGETFVELRARARAEIAMRRLRETDDKLEVVASEAGFRSRSHFVSWFRRLVGQTPEQFRRLERSVKT